MTTHENKQQKKTNTTTALSMDVGPSRTRGVLGSAGSELVVFGLDLTQVTRRQTAFIHSFIHLIQIVLT